MGKKKKKKRQLPPRHKRMKRSQRLQAGRHWLARYSGKNIVRSYKKHFAVDWKCAVIELQMLGQSFTPEYLAQLQQSFEDSQRAKQQRKNRVRKNEVDSIESDEYFAFIAGYTSNGVPYGVTWEEWEDSNDENIEDVQETCPNIIKNLSIITGYTVDRLPYGVTWEEWEQIQQEVYEWLFEESSIPPWLME